MNTNEILDRVKDEYSLTSDYQLSKKLGISRSRVSQYRTINQTMNDELVLVIEDLLEMPPGSLLLEMHAERSNCIKASKILHKMSKQLLATAASVLFAVTVTYGSFLMNSNNVNAAEIAYYDFTDNIHYADIYTFGCTQDGSSAIVYSSPSYHPVQHEHPESHV